MPIPTTENMKTKFFFTLAACGLVFAASSCSAENKEATPEVAAEAVIAAAEPAAENKEATPEAAAEPAERFRKLFDYVPEVVVADKAGGAVVTRDDLLKELEPIVMQALKAGQPVMEPQARFFARQVAEQMATIKLVLADAAKQGIAADEAKCRENLERLKAQIEGQAPGQFARELADSGMTEEQLLAKMAEQDTVMQYIKTVTDKAPAPALVTDEEARKFYEDNKAQFEEPEMIEASHILVKFDKEQPTAEEKAATLRKCQEIAAKILADGSNFAEVARESSDCPSKEQGGSLGKFKRGDMVKEFDEAVWSMEAGRVSEPVETVFGYHIIKAGPRTAATVRSFDEVKEELVNYLNGQARQKAQGEAVKAAVDKLTAEAGLDIKIALPELPVAPAAEPAPAK